MREYDFQFPDTDPSQIPSGRFLKIVFFSILLALVAVLLVVFAYQHLNTPPSIFPRGADIHITEGSSISAVADQFAAQGLVRNAFQFYVTLETTYRGESIKAGVYRFDEPISATALARAITQGTNVSPPLSVTFPEGFRVDRLLEYLPDSYAGNNIAHYAVYEGYLFPDTYFIGTDAKLDEIISLMRSNYVDKTTDLFDAHQKHPLSEQEIITLASIVEREANDEASMRMVAGILMNRLDIGMALQADATLDYLTGKSSTELTEEDLELDSPYNTYVYPGLPPGPIANPGLTAIRAVLEPVSSDYLYYLTGNDGNFYYAKTFEEHKRNKARYLR